MDAEEREQFEANRDDLIGWAKDVYDITMIITDDDKLEIAGGRLSDFYEFYQDYRPEIEEVM